MENKDMYAPLWVECAPTPTNAEVDASLNSVLKSYSEQLGVLRTIIEETLASASMPEMLSVDALRECSKSLHSLTLARFRHCVELTKRKHQDVYDAYCVQLQVHVENAKSALQSTQETERTK